MNNNLDNIAYFRHLQHKNQCLFTFHLNINTENIHINEEINALRCCDENIGSLLQHITNKINNIIKNKLKLDDYKGEDIDIGFNNLETGKKIKPGRVLKTFFNSENTYKSDLINFHIFSKIYSVIMNGPIVRELQLPSVIYAGYTLQPRKFSCLFTNHKASEFRWYKSIDKINWIEIGQDYRYDIGLNDLGHYLKLVVTPIKDGISGPPFHVISDTIVESMGELPLCPFVQRHEYTKTKCVGNQFRVVSYNVLSSRYAEINDQYNYCPMKALAIDYRKQLIGQELLGYQADIICLQEVDVVPFMNYYKSLFQQNGYSCYYHKKGNRIPEGLACIFNKQRFTKVDDRQVVYCDEIKNRKHFYYLWKMLRYNDEVKSYFLQQPTSLHVTVLKEKIKKSKTDNIIIVGNTHLFYHPDAEHIRLLQINMATTYLNYLKDFYSQSGKVHVIFCGDFNCSPSSQVFQYMIDGKVNDQLDVLKKISDNASLYHKFKFVSACGVPKYTNYTKDFKGCLDYIFVEDDNLNVVNCVPLPQEEELASFEGLPNTFYPSDHLALIVDLEYV